MTAVGKKRKPIGALCLCLVLALLFSACAPVVADGSPRPPTPSELVAPPSLSAPTSTPVPTPTPEPDFSTPTVKIQMAGDIMLHIGPQRAAKTAEGYDFTPYFSLIAPYLDGDLTVCNMEAPVDAYGENQKTSSYPQFNVPYEILPALKGAGFNFLLTANNHAYDMRWAGLLATRRNIERAGLDFTGTFETQEQYDAPKIVAVNGLKVGILSYSDADNGLSVLIPTEELPHAMRRFTSGSLDSLPDMAADIANLRAAGAQFVIAALHWGAEYRNAPTDTQRDIARALCDSGADVVMGGHSHCVQPIEWYTGPDGRESLILYSLGNFFADQIALDPPQPKTQYGMLISVSVRLDKAGALVWEGADYMPTLSYRYQDSASPTGTAYRLLPAPEYAEAETRPDVFATDAEWNKVKAAMAHVETIAGADIPVWAGGCGAEG
ncbi:MAG: CapA family protein [Oscillospiraceae bacterium]|nr:CapA family protein [Oscillospiraceae bacterium]